MYHHPSAGESAVRVGVGVVVLLTGVGLSMCADGCERREEPNMARSSKDAPLEAYRGELLDLAFGAVSAMPLDPHIKNRSRAQEAVVTACIELDEAQRALLYIEQIENWRRGAAYADLAFYCARNGCDDELNSYLNMAVLIAQEAEDWRKDRIKVKIAKTHVYLGQAQAAAEFEQGVDPAEEGKVARVRAMICTADSFDREMEELARLISTERFDAVKNALGACAELFDQFYDDDARRTAVEQRMRTSWGELPVFIRVDLLLELVESALGHSDRAKAQQLIDEAKDMIESANWQPTIGIPLRARFSGLCFRAGDPERAHEEAQAALDLFTATRRQIANIYRAGMLRSVAEAHQVMGDLDEARDLYGKAIEAGMENPNSRPRAEDLAATCCSMALHAVEPTPGLWNRIREIRDGLGDPW